MSRDSNHRSTAVFNPLKLKSIALPFIFAKVNRTRVRIPVWRELIHHRPARISESQQFRDLIERLSRGIVARLAHQPVPDPSSTSNKCVCPPLTTSASAGYSTGSRPPRLQHNRVNVTFDVIHRDQRQSVAKHSAFAYVMPTSSEPTNPGPASRRSHRDQRATSARCERFAYNRHNRTQMFPRSQFRNHSAVLAVGVEL